ncbi:DUF2798 domain-containing protein [Acinetobacter sp. WCHAc010052]|uniref:DUF2798 domain-containing protein n=1 Tax=Acinetobacter sp. WCHAc010052 TaxID=2004647 RepID=UPI000B3C8D4D|nr:DUF2798 domain-containing protein [Acinetobacter sp. WCHAc010052]AXY61513.1 DUF2798 domain-containing protein [Acinetobacter sp. WCHAc010052]
MQPERAMIFGSVPKLPMKYMVWLMPLVLSCLMSGTISFANMLMNLGWIDGFLSRWFSTWMISWLMAYPVVLIFLPLVRRLMSLIIDTAPPTAK